MIRSNIELCAGVKLQRIFSNGYSVYTAVIEQVYETTGGAGIGYVLRVLQAEDGYSQHRLYLGDAYVREHFMLEFSAALALGAFYDIQ